MLEVFWLGMEQLLRPLKIRPLNPVVVRLGVNQTMHRYE